MGFNVLTYVLLLFSFTAQSTNAIVKPSTATSQNQICRNELSRAGISSLKQTQYCQSLNPSQWACSDVIIKKYHSLELAKDICVSATTTESACFANVINRDYDPYVAKRVCRIASR